MNRKFLFYLNYSIHSCTIRQTLDVYSDTYVSIYLMSNSLIKLRKYFVNKFTCLFILKSLKLLLLNNIIVFF